MVEPLTYAVEFWLALWNNLPSPIINLANLSLGILVFFVLFRIVYTIRG